MSEGPSTLTSMDVGVGEALTEGKVIATVNGKPLFVMFGDFPLYRELKLGDTGPDALMVNGFLIRMGYLWAPLPSAEFSSASIEATKAFLVAQGYPAKKSKDWALPPDYFAVIAEQGVVTTTPPQTGTLDSHTLFSVGFGGTGLACVDRDGKVPPSLKDGQEIALTGLAVGQTLKLEILAGSADKQAEAESDSEGAPADSQETEPPALTAFVQLPDGVKPPTNKVEATVTLDTTEKAELVVPSAALWTMDGNPVVTKLEAGDARTDIPVKIIFSAGGYHAVTPMNEDDSLSEVDTVLLAESSS